MKTSSRVRAAAAGATVAIIAALGGCSALSGLFGESVTRDADSQEVTEAGSADVFTLRVGDCFDDTADGTVSDVPAVPCTDPHDNEIFSSFEMPEGDWPGDAAIDAAVEAQCKPAFASFVGLEYDASSLDMYPMTPLQDGWETIDDREILCIVWDPAGKTEGSLAGVAR